MSRRIFAGTVVVAFLTSILVSISASTPPPDNYQLPEYAWLKEDGAGSAFWNQHNNTGWNMLNLTYIFSKCNLAYVARSNLTADDSNVTFIVYHNTSAANGFNSTGHLFPGSQPNWSLTIPAQFSQSPGDYTYHLFITTFNPQGIPGEYQVRINETGPGSGSNWTSPDGNPNVQWMFFRVPTSTPVLNVTDQLGRHPPFFIDGGSPSTQFNATMVVDPPGNSTGSSTATTEWIDPAGNIIMSRTTPIYYISGLGWAARDVVPANATAFPYNGTHEYAVRTTMGYFVGPTSFRVLSTQWISVNITVEATHCQWFDPSSFKVTFTAQLDTGVPVNPYQAVNNLTLQLWNSTGFVGTLANLSWDITGYPVVPGSSYTYTWSGIIPAGWIDNSTDGSREFFGEYLIRSRPTLGMFPATITQKYFYVDDPIEAYTSLEKASSSARSAFKAGDIVWINLELDPTFLRSRQNQNNEFDNKECSITWDWPEPPPDYIKQETTAATKNSSWPSGRYWSFSTINTTSYPKAVYRCRVSLQCDTGYTVWEWKYFEIYQSYTPPTEDPPIPPYTRMYPRSNTSWHTIPIQIKLYPADPYPGTGVENTFYQIDNGDTQTYADKPFPALEGSHIYTFWSVDRAGNVENPPKSSLVKVDTQPPETDISPPSRPEPYPSPVTIILTAQDPEPGSGISKTYYMVDSSDPLDYPVDGFRALEGDHVYSFWSLDIAGNCEAMREARIKVAIPEMYTGIIAASIIIVLRRKRFS